MNFTSENADTFILTLSIVLAGIAFGLYIYYRIRKEQREVEGSTRGERIFRKAFVPVTLLVLFIAFRVNSGLIIRDAESLKVVNDILRILIIFSTTLLIINSVRIVRFFVFKRLNIGSANNLRARKIMTQFRILERIIVFILIFIAFAIALMTFEPIRRLGVSLFAGAGVAGIILGLAAQTVIGSILAGFQIAITQPIRLDDVVVVEGEWGTIEEITLTYVVVRIWDRRRLILPTTYFIQQAFQNWTRTSADILGTVFIYTDYTLDVELLRKELKEILKQSPYWDGEVGVVQVTGTDENRMEVRALMSARNSSDAWELRVFVREKLIQFIQKNYPENLPRTRITSAGSSDPQDRVMNSES